MFVTIEVFIVILVIAIVLFIAKRIDRSINERYKY